MFSMFFYFSFIFLFFCVLSNIFCVRSYCQDIDWEREGGGQKNRNLNMIHDFCTGTLATPCTSILLSILLSQDHVDAKHHHYASWIQSSNHNENLNHEQNKLKDFPPIWSYNHSTFTDAGWFSKSKSIQLLLHLVVVLSVIIEWSSLTIEGLVF